MKNQNQLTSIFNPVLEELGFLYNSDGLRTTYIEGESPSLRYLWDANNLLMEKNIAGATQLLYTYDPQVYGKLISHRWGSSSFFHLFDTLGSTLWLTDSATAIKNSYVYKAYGATVAQTVTTLHRFKWLGQVGYYDGPSGGCTTFGLRTTMQRWHGGSVKIHSDSLAVSGTCMSTCVGGRLFI